MDGRVELYRADKIFTFFCSLSLLVIEDDSSKKTSIRKIQQKFQRNIMKLKSSCHVKSNQGCTEICSGGKKCSNRIKIVIKLISENSEKFDPIDKQRMYCMNFLKAQSVESLISFIT